MSRTTVQEIKMQIKLLKNHKSLGEDEIQAEMLKNGGGEGRNDKHMEISLSN